MTAEGKLAAALDAGAKAVSNLEIDDEGLNAAGEDGTIDKKYSLRVDRDEYAMICATKYGGKVDAEISGPGYDFAADHLYTLYNIGDSDFTIVSRYNPVTQQKKVQKIVEVLSRDRVEYDIYSKIAAEYKSDARRHRSNRNRSGQREQRHGVAGMGNGSEHGADVQGVPQKGDGDSGKFSLKEDEEYLAAVSAGDTEAAKDMVAEAARAAGYTDTLFHGTKKFGFTKFDLGKSDDKISISSLGAAGSR